MDLGVKHFIEKLEPMCGGSDNPTLAFIIQSGFPEPAHSRCVARYMEKTGETPEIPSFRNSDSRRVNLGCPQTSYRIVPRMRIKPKNRLR
jgi:hypothetical protein